MAVSRPFKARFGSTFGQRSAWLASWIAIPWKNRVAYWKNGVFVVFPVSWGYGLRAAFSSNGVRSVSRISAVLCPLWLKFWVLVALTQALICYSMQQSARSSPSGKKSPGWLYKCHFAFLGLFWARENPCMVEVTCWGKTNQNSQFFSKILLSKIRKLNFFGFKTF